MIDLHHGDARDVIAGLLLDGEVFDSCVTDPPYHIESIQRRFAKPQSQRQKFGQDGRFKRATDHFHGHDWDGADADGVMIAQDVEFWRAVLSLLRPGSFCVAFSGPRSGPRQAVAMEDAGFVMHPMIPWVNAQGFPKAHEVARLANNAGIYGEAEQWTGWYGGTATLNPSCEPIYVGQVPFKGAMYRNVLKEGVGAMNVDDCRGPGGRWPSTFLHDGSEEVAGMFPNGQQDFYPAFRFNQKAKGAERREFEHPTVKPVSLVSWLCKLVTPVGGRILDPFAGSGTTGVAANENEMDCTLIEREDSYAEMIRDRFDLYDPPDERLSWLLGLDHAKPTNKRKLLL